jgi:hypothetical protein
VVGPGAAWVPGLNKVVELPDGFTLTPKAVVNEVVPSLRCLLQA